MEESQRQYVRELRSRYAEREKTKTEELRALDRKVKRPANAFAYGFGTAGALVLGTGMCFAMEVIGNSMILGVGVGILGIAMVAVNYALYRAILRARRRKYSERILALSDEILNDPT